MNLPFKIVRRPKTKPRDRVLTLEYFHTFKNGERIFTYKPTDLAKISGRYIDKVKQDISFLMEYGASKSQLEVYEDKAINLINAGLNDEKPKGEVLAELKKQFEERKTLYKYNADLNERLWLDLYSMFFVLDSEDELKFSPAQNDRKIELLMNEDDDVRQFFFSTLENLLIYYNNTFRDDIMNSIIDKTKEKEVLDYLSGQMNKPNSL